MKVDKDRICGLQYIRGHLSLAARVTSRYSQKSHGGVLNTYTQPIDVLL